MTMFTHSAALLRRLRQKIASKPRLWFGFAVVALLLLSIACVCIFSRKHTPERYQAKHLNLKLAPVSIKAHATNLNFWRDEIVQPGDNISMVLSRFNISSEEIQQIIGLKIIKDKVKHLQVNQVFSIRMDNDGHLTNIQFFNDDDNGEKNLVALKKVGNSWNADVSAVDTETLTTFKAVVVKTSARGALAQASIPVEIRESLREIFKDKIDVNTLQSGDTIRLIYDSLYYRGQELSTGDIRAAEFSHNGKLYQAYYYDTGNDGNGQYYDAHGKPLRKGFSSVPVEGARISSPFGTRFHPILQTLRMHSGIDYAVASGTPIHAPSDGTVESFGIKGGYGNAVVLRHNDSMQTLYGHMSAFANLSIGQHVRAGEIIGYVGSTGVSTGPHLHYEVRINGQPVNPTSVALPTRTLNTRELADFRQKQQHWNEQLASIRNLSVTIAQLD
ncbi:MULTISPECIES: M23 family metallopeptidase [Snodgrassella]|uniref:M23 family metallopeptidase n=1 Tax=Snodgrassella TaxID=1193515 RepID=UPI0008159A2A|nr:MULTISPECIES: M23 family metallopeptidase [Snodgrassella]SCB79384.1 Murein DD-endopeptidase MepM and murein hydrolase activator NlpD, contain LysM domain [Snodgrassella sp. R-53583]